MVGAAFAFNEGWGDVTRLYLYHLYSLFPADMLY